MSEDAEDSSALRATFGPNWTVLHWRLLLARFASGVHEDRVLRRRFAAAGAVVLLMGVIGWWRYGQSNPGSELDLTTALYRSFLLFLLDDNGVTEPPLLLNIARFAAPLVTATATIAVFLSAIRRHLQRNLARRSSGHAVLVGPVERTRPYVGAPSTTLEVHVGPELDSPERGILHVQSEVSDPSWITDANATQARFVVIATGHDDQSLAAFDRLLAGWNDATSLTVHLELQDRSAARWLAVDLARTHPDRDIEVCCFEEGLARQTATEVFAQLGATSTGPAPTVALLGDHPITHLLALHLATGLRSRHQATGGALPRLLVGDNPAAASIASRYQTLAGHVTVRATTSLAGIASAENSALHGVVAYLDRSRQYQVAVELAARRPDAGIHVTERDPFDALRIRTLDPTVAHRTGVLAGPFTRAAQVMVDELSQDPDLGWPAWDAWSREDRRAVSGWVRRTVAAAAAPADTDRTRVWEVDLSTTVNAPEPLPLDAVLHLITACGAPRFGGEPHRFSTGPPGVGSASPDHLRELPRWLFGASGLTITSQEHT